MLGDKAIDHVIKRLSKEFLLNIEPEVKIVAHQDGIDSETASALLGLVRASYEKGLSDGIFVCREALKRN